MKSFPLRRFQSTPPCGGDVIGSRFHYLGSTISIHAPLRGRRVPGMHPEQPEDFNPRPLAGATSVLARLFMTSLFQSTPPCGGDARQQDALLPGHISIHAPLRGRPVVGLTILAAAVFQSTPPCGGDRPGPPAYRRAPQFQSTPPCGGDHSHCQSGTASGPFQSTPPCGGDHTPHCAVIIGPHFNPRPLAGATKLPFSCRQQ